MKRNESEILEHTVAFWEGREYTLSHEDARISIENITGFFDLLLEWDGENCPIDNPIGEENVI